MTLARKRQQLARVLEHLRSPGLSSGIARELRKQQAILEREIAELEALPRQTYAHPIQCRPEHPMPDASQYHNR